VSLRIDTAGDGIQPGEAYLADTPVLRGHAGTQPDLFLRWNAIPRGATSIDVAVHLHGFSQQGGSMPLSEKVARGGLDLTGRTRPTLAILPRGNWIRHTWYDFPAMLDGGLDRLVDYALARFSALIPLTLPSPPLGERVAEGQRGEAEPYPELGEGDRPQRSARFRLDRLILTAHSGGGMPAVDAIAGARRPPDELFVFDGLYGRDPAGGDPLQGIEVIDRWLGERFAQEPARPGALRVIYIERQTGQFSRAVADIIARRLAAAGAELAASLAQRYRVERSAVPHGYIGAVCGPWLLADPAAALDWSRL
jgi:hypothetical protein